MKLMSKKNGIVIKNIQIHFECVNTGLKNWLKILTNLRRYEYPKIQETNF